MNTMAAIKTYNKVRIESSVAAADPHQLILMLFQGALLAIVNAKNAMLRKDIPTKGAAISQAILIIDDGLKASLNKDVGGELAYNLAALYDYMTNRLLTANLKNDEIALDEVARLLNDLKGAWESIRPDTTSTLPASPIIAQQQALPAVKPQTVNVQSTISTSLQSATVRHAMSAYGGV
ncbi:MAG: flagellar protein FliS [Candidatus Nitrotoga sp. SPKER]|nr:MAG: flagellar protein FliS [Candidatus Nitrotoga sp. SPKER]